METFEDCLNADNPLDQVQSRNAYAPSAPRSLFADAAQDFLGGTGMNALITQKLNAAVQKFRVRAWGHNAESRERGKNRSLSAPVFFPAMQPKIIDGFGGPTDNFDEINMGFSQNPPASRQCSGHVHNVDVRASASTVGACALDLGLVEHLPNSCSGIEYVTILRAPLPNSIWDLKYRFKDADGTPRDVTVRRQLAGAMPRSRADARRPLEKWEEAFL